MGRVTEQDMIARLLKEVEMLREALRNILEADPLNGKYIARKALEG